MEKRERERMNEWKGDREGGTKKIHLDRVCWWVYNICPASGSADGRQVQQRRRRRWRFFFVFFFLFFSLSLFVVVVVVVVVDPFFVCVSVFVKKKGIFFPIFWKQQNDRNLKLKKKRKRNQKKKVPKWKENARVVWMRLEIWIAAKNKWFTEFYWVFKFFGGNGWVWSFGSKGNFQKIYFTEFYWVFQVVSIGR